MTLTCEWCYHTADRDEFEQAADAYRAKHGYSDYDLRCPKPECDEPVRPDTTYDYPYEPDPEPEPSPLDTFVQEVFQPGDEESLADFVEDD